LRAAIFAVDYILVVLIGIIANALGATSYFYQAVYPLVITSVVISSVMLPILFISKRFLYKNNESTVHSIQNNTSIYLEKSA
jgi:hypothetical protein